MIYEAQTQNGIALSVNPIVRLRGISGSVIKSIITPTSGYLVLPVNLEANRRRQYHHHHHSLRNPGRIYYHLGSSFARSLSRDPLHMYPLHVFFFMKKKVL